MQSTLPIAEKEGACCLLLFHLLFPGHTVPLVLVRLFRG